MSRTTPGAVQAVLDAGRNYDTVRNPSLQPFCDMASVVVDRLVTAGSAKGFGVSDATAELIERWLGAYYYCQSDPTYRARSTAGGSGTFNVKDDQFARAAMDADPTGLLASILKNKQVGGGWLGKPPSQQIPYCQRD